MRPMAQWHEQPRRDDNKPGKWILGRFAAGLIGGVAVFALVSALSK